MTAPLPARISGEGRVATWNPALTRAQRVTLEVVCEGGRVDLRASMNSGRARVREGETIRSVTPAEE
jgi:hypothetical protein